MKTNKKMTRGEVVKRLDSIFSKWVRLRGAKITPDGRILNKCCTCGVVQDITKMDAGHYISRGKYATRWSEDNVHPQCLTEDSKLRMSDGTSKSIADVKVGDKLCAFDEDTLERKVAVVESTDSFIPSELYEVEMENGDKFYATGDHRVVANGKWEYVKHMWQAQSTYDILSYEKAPVIRVKSIKKVEPRRVHAVQTSTGTFIADGLAHHNCKRCNIFLKGNYTSYALFMVKTYGYSKLQELDRRSKSTEKIYTYELLEKIEYYKMKAKGIERVLHEKDD